MAPYTYGIYLTHTKTQAIRSCYKSKTIAYLTNRSITMTADFKKAEILHSSLTWSFCTFGLCSLHYLHIQAGNGSVVELLLMLHVCNPAGKIMYILTTLALSPS